MVIGVAVLTRKKVIPFMLPAPTTLSYTLHRQFRLKLCPSRSYYWR